MRNQRFVWKVLLAFLFVALSTAAMAQWTLGGSPSLTSPTDGVTVGTTTSAPPGALTIRGNEMNSPTGVVFTTYTGNSVVHSWRMNKGSGQEWIGHIFNPSSSSDKTFNIDARSDNLRFLTNEVHRAALWYRVGNQTINSSSFNQSGYFGLSLNQNFITNSSSTGPFSLFHMVDAAGGTTVGTYAPTLGFRGWMKNGITLTGNSDQMYIGHKYATVDGVQQNGKSQAVVQWSEGTF